MDEKKFSNKSEDELVNSEYMTNPEQLEMNENSNFQKGIRNEESQPGANAELINEAKFGNENPSRFDEENKGETLMEKDKNVKDNSTVHKMTDDLHNANLKVDQNFEDENRHKGEGVGDTGEFLGNEIKNKENKNVQEGDNVDFMVNPSGSSEDAGYVKNKANEVSKPGKNSPNKEELEQIGALDKDNERAQRLLAEESYDSSNREKVEYQPSEEIDDGDVYDKAIDVRELHKNDENLVDGWTSENPAERDLRIEKEMERDGKLLDFTEEKK